ncbi:MAG: endonuclease/exonuclease/phosphatase family protein [Alphaproteobacteria bacterium]
MIIEILSIAVLALTLIGLSRWLWWFTVIDFFRLHYALLALILMFFAGITMNLPFLILNVITFTINLIRMRSFMPVFDRNPQCMDKTIFSVNAHKSNKKPEKLKKIIKNANPDVLLIMEMTDHLKDALKEELAYYPHTLSTCVRDGFSIYLLSKHPMEDKHVHHCPKGKTPLLCAKITLNGTRYQIYSAHPKPVLSKKWRYERYAYFKEIENILKKQNLPIIMLGDFNSVPWEPHFKNFLQNNGLKSTLDGQGYCITWPAFLPFFGVPMDHILIEKDQRFDNLCIGPYCGSDHYPISIDLDNKARA